MRDRRDIVNIYEKLMKIQTELKAPKNQFNSFGNYNYRSQEDILEGLKPLLAEYKAAITIVDEIVLVGERYYVKATARLIDIEKGDEIWATAYAREDETKKGMDLSQLTGSTSSYARKYALNGLFAIDDTKDSDYTNKHDMKAVDKPKTKSKADNQSKYVCGDCNAEINQAVNEYSTKNLGRPLCFNCQQKYKKG